MEKLASKFNSVILAELKKSLGRSNDFAVPQLEKIVVSTGTGDYKEDKNTIEKISVELAKITGQKPKLNLSRKAVSAFKLRIGQPVGLTVTLRGERMYDFVDRLVNTTLPRVRDFRGLKDSAFDKQGNYSIGLRDYSIFPEVKYEEISVNFGLEICIKTTAKTAEDGKALLAALGFPFSNKEKKD